LLGPQLALFNTQADAHAKAAGLFGVVYAPRFSKVATGQFS